MTVVLLCLLVQEEPLPDSVVRACRVCDQSIWVSASGYGPAQERAKREGSEVITLCVACGEALERWQESEGTGVEWIPLTPEQWRAAYERRERRHR